MEKILGEANTEGTVVSTDSKTRIEDAPMDDCWLAGCPRAMRRGRYDARLFGEGQCFDSRIRLPASGSRAGRFVGAHGSNRGVRGRDALLQLLLPASRRSFYNRRSGNWIALAAFLVTALVASHLSDRAKQQALEAKRRQMETEQLYALSRAILLTDASQRLGRRQHTRSARSSARLASSFSMPRPATFQGGPEDLHGLEDSLKQAVLQGSHCFDKETGADIWPISLGGHSVGALAVKGMRASDGALQALINLVAIAIERVRTENAANRAEAARQSEEFKSTLLDAVAHEFKTPLTSIKAASTALLADGERLKPETSELLSVIDEETDRLTSLVTEAVRMSQIDAGKVRLERSALSVEALLEPAISSFGSRAEGRIEGRAEASPSHRIHVDREMMVLALRQLIDNALKYAPPSSSITVWTEQRENRVLIHVADQGPGIPEQDRERTGDRPIPRGSLLRFKTGQCDLAKAGATAPESPGSRRACRAACASPHPRAPSSTQCPG